MMFATDPAQQAAAWKFMKFITGAQGATIMVKGTGYMPPNSLPANDPAMLKGYYAEKPNHLTSLSQQPLMTAWYAFPGREQPQDHPGDQGPPADGGRQVGRAGGGARPRCRPT